MSEPVTIVLTMTPDEAKAVSAVLRGYIADRWGEIDPVAKACGSVQGRIQHQLSSRQNNPASHQG